MKNTTVCIMVFDKKTGAFQLRGEFTLSRIPVIGEKITTEGTESNILEVVDVHFADGNLVDVFVISRGNIVDYLATLAAIAKSK